MGEHQQKARGETTGKTDEVAALAEAAAVRWEQANPKTSRSGTERTNRGKADEEHPEEPERSDAKRMSVEKEEDEESRLKRTMKYLKKQEKTDANADIAGAEVNEEELDME